MKLLPSKKKRIRAFRDNWVPEIKESYNITERGNRSFTIQTNLYGTIDYYPIADRLLFRENNEWISNGLSWINENL